MPENIIFDDFTQGWCPSDDAIKGRKNALLQMDNLELNRNGAITLTSGANVIRTYAANVHSLHTSMVGTVRNDYAGLVNGGLYRNSTSLSGSGSASRAAFGTAYKYTLACSGDVRLKDDGTTAINLGIKAPTAEMTLYNNVVPTVNHVLPLLTYNIIPGGAAVTTFGGVSLQCIFVGDTYVCQSYNVPSIPFDWQADWTPAATGTEDDYIYMNGLNFYPEYDTLTLDICLQTPGATATKVDNYFTATIPNDAFSYDSNSFKVKIKRSYFVKVGPDNFGWDSVRGFRITIKSTFLGHTDIYMQSGAVSTVGFTGSSVTQNGLYEYAQMNVNNTGQYLAKSALGPKSELITQDMTSSIMNIQNPTAIDSQVNEVWIYRRSVDGLGLLDQWYRVAVILAANFGNRLYDYISDKDALALDLRINNNILPILSTSITDTILDIIGPINGRWYYFTNNYMYPSEINNPDSVDVSLAIKTTAGANEIFMWARQIAEGVILIGTSYEIYTLTGTFATLPDQSVDIYFRNLSVHYPPISIDVAVFSGTAFYMANDGWRSVDSTGINKSLVAPNTDRLYRKIDCHGYVGVDMRLAPGEKRFPVCIGKNKIWCFITGYTRAEIWDFHRQYWRVLNNKQTTDYYPTLNMGEVTAACATKDGQIFAAYGDSKLRAIDLPTSKQIDVNYKQGFLLQTPVLDGKYPRRRKDCYTLKIRMLNAGNAVAIKILTDDGTVYSLANIPTSYDMRDVYIDLKTYFDKFKTVQIQMSGLVDDLVIEDFDISFDLLPEQLTHLRIRPENYGTTGSKRLFGVPFVIDTLGNNVNFVPTVDDVVMNPLTVNCNRKKSFTYEFPLLVVDDIIRGVDYQYDLSCSSGMFEWYGFMPPKHIELFPEPLISYVIPITNFGTACRKRLRVWPCIINTKGNNVTFIPITDDVPDMSNVQIINTVDYVTVRLQYKTDVFGVDYSGAFSSINPFELGDMLAPEIVQVLPIAKQFDQLGPEELFREGKIKQFEIRLLPNYEGTFGQYVEFPYKIFMQDSEVLNGVLSVISGAEASYFISIPKGVTGNILRVELGPTSYFFHRFYARFQVINSGADTELNWVTIPGQQ